MEGPWTNRGLVHSVHTPLGVDGLDRGPRTDQKTGASEHVSESAAAPSTLTNPHEGQGEGVIHDAVTPSRAVKSTAIDGSSPAGPPLHPLAHPKPGGFAELTPLDLPAAESAGMLPFLPPDTDFYRPDTSFYQPPREMLPFATLPPLKP